MVKMEAVVIIHGEGWVVNYTGAGVNQKRFIPRKEWQKISKTIFKLQGSVLFTLKKALL